MEENYKFEKENSEYPFLNVPKPDKKEHYEVTKYSIKILQKNYPIYRNNWEIIERNKEKLRQTSSPGWGLRKKQSLEKPRHINTVCDIITTPKVFNSNVNIEKFKNIYRTIGNFMPTSEAGNYGGQKGSDNYYLKLNRIKKFFDNADNDKDYKLLTDDEIKAIENRLCKGCLLGNLRKYTIKNFEKENGCTITYPKVSKDSTDIQLRYWLLKEWIEIGKKWPDFVKDNYFQDMVDEKYIPILFNKNNADESIIMIIKRGYRIFNHGKELSDKQANEILEII